MKRLFLDIETIPGQAAWIRNEFAERYMAHHQARADALRAEIETVRPPANLKDPAKIEAWERDTKPGKVVTLEAEAAAEERAGEAKTEEDWRKTSFDGALGQIVVIGFAFDDVPKPATLFVKDKCTELGAEAEVIRQFFKALDKVPMQHAHELVVVGHNVNDFDLRFIWQRAVIHGIKVPHWMPWNSKPWGDRVFDTMVQWSGAKGRISLDKLCRVLGVSGKGSEIGCEIDGSKVWDFVKAGRIAEVAKYCAGDVDRAREIYQRLAFVEAIEAKAAA